MGVREQLIRDCVLLGDFAEKSVETMKAGDEKGVIRLYTGASQANVLMLLTGIGCILAALAPVLWLFAVSTESLAFFVLLSLALVLVAVVLGARTLGGAVKAQAVDRTTGLSAWFVIFLVVALQALTLVRPILSPIGAERKPDGKCFFFAHFTQCMVHDLTKGSGK